MTDLLANLHAAFEPAGSDEYGRIFNTYWFILFAAATTTLFWVLRRPGLRLWFLAIACVVFHFHFAGPAGMLPIVELGVVTYLLGLTRHRFACAAGIAFNVLALCFYKYTHFFAAEVLGHLSPALGAAMTKYTATGLFTPGLFAPGTAEKSGFIQGLVAVFPALRGLPAAPPLAMSFFAFEFVHYLFEVRRGGEPIRSPLKFTLFSLFFPSLVAGPIKRYGQFLPSLEAGARDVGAEDFAAGFRRIGIGFLKKVVIADNLTVAIDHYVGPYVNGTLPMFGAMDHLVRWTVLLMIALQILLDFSGYSDIAIGLARLLGVRIPENFNWPYAALSIQEFWQRWHISLSSWIRDYVYIPLGGNRHGVVRKILNGLIAFGLCGLWHGAAWNFILWGLYHGLGLAICSNYAALPGLGPRLHALLGRRPRLCWLATQLFVALGWLLFFYPAEQAWLMTVQLFS